MAEIIRRDPRLERIARNRLHPLHQSLCGAVQEVRGPTGILRKDPRAAGFIGPNGIKRIDRSAASGPVAGMRGQRIGGAKADTVSELPLHQIPNPDFLVAAVLDLSGGRLSSHDKDVLGQARLLAQESGAVVGIVFGDIKETAFDKAGVDRLIHIDNIDGATLQGYCPELKLAALEAVETQLAPRHWLFPDSVQGGAELGRRFAARLGERPAAQAWQVDTSNTICRGGSDRIDIARQTPRVLLLAEECALPVDETRHEALPISIEFAPLKTPLIEDLGPVNVDPSQIPLAEAEFILAAGNGVRDWDQFHDVAAMLGATEGASRVAVDDGFMPRFRQVGATGTWVTARVYVAVGISGAIQHLQGIGQCEKVVAINLDAGCDMVKRADLSVIGSSQEILAELRALIASRQGDTSATENADATSGSNQSAKEGTTGVQRRVA